MSVYKPNQKYLIEAIESIINQSYKDFEFIIVNDGDNVILNYESFDSRIKVIHNKKNIGLTKSLNIALKEAKGEYIARMDADDISMPDRFELQVTYMDENPNVGVLGSQIEIIGTCEKVKKPLTDESIRWWFFKGNPIAHPSVFIRKAVLVAHGLEYNSSLQPTEDFDMWWRMAQVTQLANLNEVLLKYRYHEQQESTAKAEIQQKHHNNSLNSFFQQVGLISEYPRITFISKIYSDELTYNYTNLKSVVGFLKKLNNHKAIKFFGVDSIEKKTEDVVNTFIERMSSYHPSMLFFLTLDSIKRFHNQKNQSILKFIFKCLVCWKTRIK